MKHKLITALLCLLASVVAMAQTINRAEYFINTDPGPGAGTAITVGTAADSVTLNFSVPMAGRQPGFYKIAVRTRAGSKWGQAQAALFYVTPPVTGGAGAGQISKAEYFVDTDPGPGGGTPIATGSAADSVSASFSFAVSALSQGFHRIGVRARSTGGQWGTAQAALFYVTAPVTGGTGGGQIARLEYFVDADPGPGLGTAIASGAAADSVSLTVPPIALTGLAQGFHRISIRARSVQGAWSIVQTALFYITPPMANLKFPSRLARAEYYFDGIDPGTNHGLPYPNFVPGDSIDLTRALSACGLSVGQHTITLRVADSAGRWSYPLVDTFMVTQGAPTIASFAPAQGPIGQSVVITGCGFTGATAVKFNTTSAASFTVNSNTQITAAVAAGTTTGKITVTKASLSGQSAGNFTVILPPTVSAISPTTGYAGDSVTVTGTNLNYATAVKFGTTAAGFRIVSATSLKAAAPAGLAGAQAVQVTNPAGSASFSSFSYVPAPTITGFNPPSITQGSTITITGTTFVNVLSVAFNGTAATAYTVNSATQITATIPAGAQTGYITVTTKAGTATSASQLVVCPGVGSIQPDSVFGGDTIRVTGNNLSSVTSVKINNIAVGYYRIVNDGLIKIVAPGGNSGTTLPLAIANATCSSTGNVNYYPAPTVTGFTPASGPAGTSVVITGTNFISVLDVRFNGFSASYVVNSRRQITATVPNSATTGKVLVFTKAGAGQSTADFTVTGSANPLDWRWVRRAVYSTSSTAPSQDRFNRVRVTYDGNVYAAGTFTGTSVLTGVSGGATQTVVSAGGLDGLLTRYNKQGVLQWATHFASSAGDDEVLGLATDKFGYAYVSGYFTGTMSCIGATGTPVSLTSAGGKDAFVAKVHPDGHIVYAYRFGATADDQASGVDVAPDLRLYVAGSFVGTTTVQGISGTAITITSRGLSDAFLAKFSDIGTLYWLIQAGGTANDFAYGAAADIKGGGYLMGSYEGTATFNSSLSGTTPISKTVVGGSDGFVLRVSITGQLKWVSSMGGTTNENVRDVAPDPRGTGVVAVGGFSQTASFGATSLSAIGFYDAFATRLDTNGNFIWATRAGGFGQDQGWGVRLDRTGNPIVALSYSQSARNFGGTANTLTAVGNTDGLLVKLAESTGTAMWSATLGGPNNDQARGVDTADGGGAYGAGVIGDQAAFATYATFPGSALGDGWVGRYATGPTYTREATDEALVYGPALALRVWPNPANAGSIFVQADGVEEVEALYIYGADGRLATRQAVTGEALQQGLRLDAALPAGLYTLRCGSRVARLVVR